MLDAIVIGGGINGSWTALHLTKRGQNITLLDQVLKKKLNTQLSENDYSKVSFSYIQNAKLRLFTDSFRCRTLVEVRMDKVEGYAKPILNRF